MQKATLFELRLKAPETRTGHHEADGFPVLDASELDFYLFNREARMNEVWGSTEDVKILDDSKFFWTEYHSGKVNVTCTS